MLACRTPFSLWIWLKRGTGKASTEQTRRSGKSISGKNREKTGNGITDSASDYVRFYSHFSFLRSLLLVPLFTVFRYDTKKMRLGPPVHTWTTVNGLQIWNLKEFIFCFSTPSWAVHRPFISLQRFSSARMKIKTSGTWLTESESYHQKILSDVI